MNARLSFLIAFLLAGGGAFALSALDFRWVSVGWAVLVMLGFLAWVKLRLPDYADSQGFADDFYFLGFLLTLVALATALLRLGDLGQADLLSTVLSQFGLALATTILGLAVRTALLLDKEEAEGTEERARRRVEKAFDSLAQSLTRLSTETDVFSLKFAGKLKDSLMPVETTVSRFAMTVDVMESEVRETAAAARLLSQSVKDASARLTETSQGLSAELEAAGRRFREQLDLLASGTRESGAVITQEAAGVVAAIDQIDGRARSAVDETLNRLDRVVTSLSSAGKDVSRASNEVASGLAQDLRSVAEGLDELRVGTEGIVAEVASGADGLKEAKQEWKAQIDEFTEVQRELVVQASASGRAVAEVRREIAEGVEQLVEALRGLDHQ